ncbi:MULTISPECIES: hypothetical protein [unclassified Sphingomonas]|uniref:hypothetical protein n=1 Tax=unclassified Sphingomonas TaxID=196159 RepID=UPI00226AF720|nr:MULTISPECIES: hypothetical protein [unclassified Sphingomonas]
MAEVVDSIVANLEVRYQQYVDGFEKATKALRSHKDALTELAAVDATFSRRDGGKQAGDAQVQTNAKVARSAKQRSAEEIAAADAVKKAAKAARDAERAAAKAASDAVKAAEREKQAALQATQREQEKAAKAAQAKAEAERVAAAAATAAAERETAARARLAAVVDRAAARSGVVPAAGGGRIGATVPRESTGQRSIPAAALDSGAAAEVTAETQINHLLADQAALQSRVGTATGKTKQQIQDTIAELQLESRLRKAGLADEEILLQIEQRRTFVASARAETERKQTTAGLKRFAEGAGIGRSFGSGATVTGVATAVGVGVGVEVIQSAVDYGKALDNLSKQLGITVEDLQAYERIARDTGVSTEQMTSAFGQFASNLGRAQEGGQEQAKVFKALGVDIKDFASAGDALPTVIDRISSIREPASRAAIETRLFGEEGRRLDALLSGGAARVSDLAASLQATGQALSQKEIQELDDTARKLADVKNQLQVDLSKVVAGNAASIIGLANSFEILAKALLNLNASKSRTADASLFDVERSRRDVPTLLLGRAAGKTDAQTEQEAFARQSTTAEGRAAIRATITQSRARLNGQNGLLSSVTGPETFYSADQRKKALAYYDRLEKQLAQAERTPAAAPRATAPVQAGSVNSRLLGSLGAPKPPKGKSAEQKEREAEQRERQFNDQLASAQADYLRAQEQMTGSVDRRAEIEQSLLESSYKTRLLDIESQRSRNVLAGADAKLEDARAAELKAAEKKAHDANAAAVEQDRRLEKERALTAATDSLLDVQNTLLSAQASLATTAKDRRAALLKVVDNEQARESNRLGGIISTSKPGDPAQVQALTDFQSVQTRYDAQRRSVVDQTLSPLEQYKKDLHSATDDTNAALQGVEVNALQSLEDSISRSIGKVLGLKGAFGDLFGSVLSDIAKIELKKGILALLGGSASGDGGGGNTAGGIGKLIGSVIGAFSHHAGGGNVVGGVPIEVGENGREVFVPSQSGKIVPNNARVATPGGGTVLHQTFNVDASGVNPEGFAGGIISAVRHETTQAIRASSAATLDAAPARVNRLSVLGG